MTSNILYHFQDLHVGQGSQGQYKAKPVQAVGFISSHTFQLIRMKFVVVMILLLSEIYM